MKPSHTLTLLFFASIITLSGCADLTVQNLNEPGIDQVLANESDVRALANDLFRQWYITIHNFQGPQFSLSVAADAATCSWGKWQAFGTEPRPAWNNEANYSYAYQTSVLFEGLYSINSSASDVVSRMEKGMDFNKGVDNPQIMAQAKLAQALSIGYIALLFDKGYIVDENSTIEQMVSPEFQDYSTLMDYALSKLYQVIEITENNTFVLDENVIRNDASGGISVDNILLGQIAHSFAARFMISLPRNVSEKNQVNWTLVEEHALKGINSDLNIHNDQWTTGFWYNESYQYTAYPGWGRIDMRVINMMDSSYPDHNTNGEDFAQTDSAVIFNTPTIDNRFWSDYEYLHSNVFRPDRGVYFFSNWRHSRYDNLIATESGLLPEISYSEIQTILAVAYLYQNEFTKAAAVLNNSARISRGGLPSISGIDTEIKGAVEHEIMVEQFGTGAGNEFFFMRRNNKLQQGTILHFPVPASVLEILGEEKPYYTFGGYANADGVNTSNGGWR